ncbi:MAG: hypothetical protein QM765_29920 [Myxococcales bacterium]
MNRLFALAVAACLALSACAPDACGAAWTWAKSCGLTVLTTEADFRKSCEASMDSCTESQRSEAATFYGCMTGKQYCGSTGATTCAQNMSLGAVACVNSID